ncbi:DUF6682 family protein [Uliginosibacterium sp. 31-12]|uniref:DUF6682 family protein n=1 Tax=Uliginosibacterium sp. 31-12 TaxID=3062781 RepID=UPI0026E43759|nr:DUF6682 family protein [Uliginosibacterium sp. 31-12]MDO6385582.1 hypothetical protein [Uliginosibacterium sp. 31-12]
MAITGQQVEAAARIGLNDRTAPYRWDSTAVILPYLNAGLAILKVRRPDAFFGNWSAAARVAEIADSLPVADEFLQPLADYVCARCNMIDEEEASQALASGFFSAFAAQIAGG